MISAKTTGRASATEDSFSNFVACKLFVSVNVRVRLCSSFSWLHTHMNELVLGVVLLHTALPVAVGLVYGLRLLFALVFVQLFAQVQNPAGVVL